MIFTHLIDGLPAAQEEIHECYAERFDVDPEPGRRWAAENLAAGQDRGRRRPVGGNVTSLLVDGRAAVLRFYTEFSAPEPAVVFVQDGPASAI